MTYSLPGVSPSIAAIFAIVTTMPLRAVPAATVDALDLLTTYFGLGRGLTESNPMSNSLILNGTYPVVKLVYSAAILLFGYLFWLRWNTYREGIRIAGTGIMGILTTYFLWILLQNLQLILA